MRRVSKWHRDAVRILTVAAVVLGARSSLANHYVVPTGSMEPTVLPSDRVVVNKLAYGLRLPLAGDYSVRFEGPARGDVVVLDSPEDGKVLLKRVVAVGGDRVEVDDGRLTLNGHEVPVDEAVGTGLVETLGAHAHALRLDGGGGPDFGPVTVPPGKYLVLGDNRGNSHDGRMFGFVGEELILGRVVGAYFHGGKFGWTAM
jgi:signal peptidase I